jgi:hypothetical protein
VSSQGQAAQLELHSLSHAILGQVCIAILLLGGTPNGWFIDGLLDVYWMIWGYSHFTHFYTCIC